MKNNESKLGKLALKKETITRLNDSEMQDIKGGGITLSCSNAICGAFSVGKTCDGGTLSINHECCDGHEHTAHDLQVIDEYNGNQEYYDLQFANEVE